MQDFTLYNFKKNKKMINRIIRAVAGAFILISLLLSIYFSQNWLWFTAFVGANLLQSSFTKWCLMEDILKKLGMKD
jgi:disulfide bond formation protein DsbB